METTVISLPTRANDVVLVTHADSDCGCEVAMALLDKGIRVAVTARQATALTRILHGRRSDRVMAVSADADDAAQWARLLERVEQRLGPVTAVIDGRDPSGPSAISA